MLLVVAHTRGVGHDVIDVVVLVHAVEEMRQGTTRVHGHLFSAVRVPRHPHAHGLLVLHVNWNNNNNNITTRDDKGRKGMFYLMVHSTHFGARCSSVVRAFAHGVMGRRIDPSWWTHSLWIAHTRPLLY